MKRASTAAAVIGIGAVAAVADAALLFGPSLSAAGSVGEAGAAEPLGATVDGGGAAISGSSDAGSAAGDTAAGDSAAGDSAAGDSAATAGSSAADDAQTGSSSADAGATASDGAYKDGTYTGEVVTTGKGDVQVSVTVEGGRVTSVAAVKYPNDNPRSQSLSKTAIPQLSSEAVEAQSADIQMVSGATETSTGFIGSLQDALNQAS